MAKVYVSSTVLDLETERRAVIDWLVATNHQPVHSYRPDSETVRESCLDDIDGCDLFVLILGHRYGFQPDKDNPEKLSITHLEFRRAGESRIPRIALLRTSVPDIMLSDLLDPPKADLVKAFNEEVRLAVRPAEFKDAEGLIRGLSTGVQRELDRRRRESGVTSTTNQSVFVCYARSDLGVVLPFVEALRSQDVPVWVDKLEIPPSADWDKAIEQALYACTEFLIVLSPASVDSDEVRAELRVALNEDKPVIPVLFRKCRIPRRLMLTQYVDYMNRQPDDRAGLAEVVSALSERAATNRSRKRS